MNYTVQISPQCLNQRPKKNRYRIATPFFFFPFFGRYIELLLIIKKYEMQHQRSNREKYVGMIEQYKFLISRQFLQSFAESQMMNGVVKEAREMHTS